MLILVFNERRIDFVITGKLHHQIVVVFSMHFVSLNDVNVM